MDPPRPLGRRRIRRMLALMLLGASGAPLHATQPARPGEEIVIIGPQLTVLPERTLGEEDVAAYGLGTVGELLDEIIAEQGETRDRPVILVDGRRVPGLGDIEEYPSEAIARIEVLPTGTATKVGQSANRRVYNIVLKAQARTIVGRAAGSRATDGNWGSVTADLSATDIRKPRRLNLTARLRSEDALRESDRPIVQPEGSPANLGRFRTLRPSLDGFDMRIAAADRLAPWLDGSVTAKFAENPRRSLLGLAADGSVIERRSRTRAASLDLQLIGEVGEWEFSFAGTYSSDRRRTDTDNLPASGGFQTIIARTRSAVAELLAYGPVLDLPAGKLRATIGARLSRDAICSKSSLDAAFTRDCLTQSSRDLTAAIDVPIASRSAGILRPLGDLSASVRVQRGHTNGLGTLVSRTYSLTWVPTEWMRLFGAVTRGRTPPSVELLAAPPLATPGVRYFDPLLGQSVDVLQVSGGNPDLPPQQGTNDRIEVTIKPLRSVAFNITGEYARVRNRDLISALPQASELALRAFPERFVRDSNGVLRLVDIRPVSFARLSEEQLRYAFNLSLPLGRRSNGKSTATSGDDRGTPGRPRLQLNFAHTILLNSKLLIRPGFEPVDLLSRDAIALAGASRPRHQIDVTLGYAERGLGVHLDGLYRSTSFLSIVSGISQDVLRFSPLTRFNLRLFADGARLMPIAGWLEGARVTLSLLNITNARQQVRDSSGMTPLAYRPAYFDPVGRTVQVELRKRF